MSIEQALHDLEAADVLALQGVTTILGELSVDALGWPCSVVGLVAWLRSALGAEGDRRSGRVRVVPNPAHAIPGVELQDSTLALRSVMNIRVEEDAAEHAKMLTFLDRVRAKLKECERLALH